MLELCETSVNPTQPQPQPLPCPLSQSVGQALVRKLGRAHSVVSQRSLFSNSSSPPSPIPDKVTVEMAPNSAVTKHPNNTALANSGKTSLKGSAITPVLSAIIPSVALMLDSSLDTSFDEIVNRPTVAGRIKHIFVDEEEPSTPDRSSPVVSSAPTGIREPVIEIDPVPELDIVLPDDSLPPPFLLSPESREIQDLLSGSSKAEGNSIHFEPDGDDIPCKQIVEELQNEAASSQNNDRLSQDPNWNPNENDTPCFQTSGSDSQTSMKSILLEYDMPEIDFQASEDSMLYNLDVNSQGNQFSSQACSQVSTTAVRKQLLKLCSQSDVSPFSLVDAHLVDSDEITEDSEAEESLLMSQQVWDVNEHEKDCFFPDPEDFRTHKKEVGKPDKDLHVDKSALGLIPQLDGGTETPKTVNKTTRRTKTLGVRRRIKRNSGVENSTSECTSTTNSSECNVDPVKKTEKPRLSLRLRRNPPNTGLNTITPTTQQLMELARANCFSVNVKKMSVPILLPASQRSSVSSKRTLVLKRGRKRKLSDDQEVTNPFCKEKSGKLAHERKKRYSTRCGVKGMLTYSQQLKMALELSLQEVSPSSTDATPKSERRSQGPQSESSSVEDLNRTIIEESPFEDARLSDNVHTKEQSQNITNADLVTTKADDGSEKSSEGLDTSFCSIPESPPFTSSPVQREFTLELKSDVSTHNSLLGSPIFRRFVDDQVKKKPPPSIMSAHATSKDIYLPEIMPRTHLHSPDKETDSNSSEELDNVSCDEFHVSCDELHLAVTSESEGELPGLEQINRSDSLEASMREQHLNSHVTLKRDNNIRLRAVDHISSSLLDGPNWCDGYATQKLSKDTVIVTPPEIIPPTTESLMDSISKCDLPSHSSEEVDNVSCDDFHLAVTSESEEELPEQMNKSDSLEASMREQHISSHITLKRDNNIRLRAVDYISSSLLEGSNWPSMQRVVSCTSIWNSNMKIQSDGYATQKHSKDTVIVTPETNPPTTGSLMASLSKYDLPSGRHQQPFCRDPEDVQPPKYVAPKCIVLI